MAITLRRTITDETPKILEFLKDYTSNMGWELVNGGEIPDKNLTFKRTTLGNNYQIGMLGNKVRSIYRAGSETAKYKTFGSGTKARNYYTYDSSIYDEIVLVVENYYTEGAQITLKLYENTSTNEIEYTLGMSHGYNEQDCLNFSVMGKRHNGTVDIIGDGRGPWDKLKGDNITQFNDDAPYKTQYLMGGILGERVYTLNYELIVSNVKKSDGTIEPVKVFKTYDGARAYFNDGTLDDLIDGEPTPDEEDPAEDRITTLFYASDIYSRAYNDSTLARLGASTIYIDIQYAKNDGTIIVDKNRAICGYVNTNNAINDENHFGNIIWIAANNVKILETKQSWLNGGFADTKTLPQFATTTGFYGPLIEGNTFYESRYNTNMRIFANKADAENFLRGGNPTPIAGGTNAGQFNPDMLVGDPTVYNNPTANITSDMSSCWILTKNEVNELANIFATGLTSQESEENGLLVNTLITTERSFLAHSEPIDSVIDLFWLPFDPREFSENSTSHMSFVSDTYGIFEALGEAVDSAGEVIKGAYSHPIGRSFLPGGTVVGYIERWNELADVIESTVGESSTANKINVGTHHIE